MNNLFKTLVFTDRETFAHPIEVDKDTFEWADSHMPLLMTMKTTIRDLRKLYKGLDFIDVKLVVKKLVDIETNNS